MRKIKWTNAFRRDFKKNIIFDGEFIEALWKLANDEVLPESFHDHALSGNLKDCRDCHVKPDLLLIYRKPDKNTLELIRLASHSALNF
jgi:mRNA interferase YafQ